MTAIPILPSMFFWGLQKMKTSCKNSICRTTVSLLISRQIKTNSNQSNLAVCLRLHYISTLDFCPCGKSSYNELTTLSSVYSTIGCISQSPKNLIRQTHLNTQKKKFAHIVPPPPLTMSSQVIRLIIEYKIYCKVRLFQMGVNYLTAIWSSLTLRIQKK